MALAVASPTYLPLRILYTVNESPQYILARSVNAVAVIPHHSPPPDPQSSTQPLYGMVAWKACIETLCHYSPELVQDNKDYSIYLNDPTESTPGSTQKGGVIVAFGLLSDALQSDERSQWSANGTFTKLHTGRDAFQVVLALKETTAPRLKQKTKQRSRLVFESDKLLPPLVKRSKSSAPTSLAPAPSFTSTSSTQPTPASSVKAASSVAFEPIPSQASACSQDPPLASQLPNDPATLLVLLQLIDAAKTQSPDPSSSSDSQHDVLATALKQILAGYALPPSATALTPSPLPSTLGSDHIARPARPQELDDEIIILDKENVNPASFRYREKDHAYEPLTSRPLSPPTSTFGKGIGNNAHAAGPSANTPPTVSTSFESTRKRRLSEVLDGRDAVREQERARKSRPAQLSSDSGPYRHYPIRVTQSLSALSHSSPPRQSTDHWSVQSASRIASQPVSSPAPAPVANSDIPRKRFVVPDWAKTSTATKPTLSKQKLEELEAAKHHRAEECEAKTARKQEARKKKHDSLFTRTELRRPNAAMSACTDSLDSTPVSAQLATVASRPTQRKDDLPVFASSDGFEIRPSSPPPPLSTEVSSVPHTPPRKRRSNPFSTPTRSASLPNSLFTPTPRARAGIYNSPLFSPGSPIRRPGPSPSSVLRAKRASLTSLTLTASTADGSASSVALAVPSTSVLLPADPIPCDDAANTPSDFDISTTGSRTPRPCTPEPDQSSSIAPSSPLPPSSPPPMSQDEYMADPFDISEADVATPSTEADNPGSDGASDTPHDLTAFFNFDAAGSDSSFTPGVFAQESTVVDADFMQLFNTFTDHRTAPTSEGPADPNMNVLEEFDFTQFWQNMNPLAGAGPSGEGMTETSFGVFPPQGEELNHNKMAEDMQALLSGCLL